MFDVDGKGLISVDELRQAIMILGDDELKDKLSKREIEEMLQEADGNRDGMIQYEGWLGFES